MKIFSYVLILLMAQLRADSLFCPLPNDHKANLSLIKWMPVPYRIQYHGFIESDHRERYIFRVDGEMVYLHLNETAKQQFMLRQVLLNGRQVLTEDILTHELCILTSGEASYIPNKFKCTLLDEASNQPLHFSDAQNSYKTDDRDILVSLKDSGLHVWDKKKDKEPMLYVFPIVSSK